MADPREIELVFEPQEGGGYHVYAPELPGLHTQGDDMDDALTNANEAVALYVEETEHGTRLGVCAQLCAHAPARPR